MKWGVIVPQPFVECKVDGKRKHKAYKRIPISQEVGGSGG